MGDPTRSPPPSCGCAPTKQRSQSATHSSWTGAKPSKTRSCDRALDLGAVDEDECHLAVSVGAVGPRVAGGSLDEHIATLHQCFALVHHRPDLAVENDGVVEGRGGVKEEVAVVRRLVVLVGDDRGEKLCHRFRVVFGVGREVDDPQDRAVRRGAAVKKRSAGAGSSPSTTAGVVSVAHMTCATFGECSDW